jgi:hypothetical protein
MPTVNDYLDLKIMRAVARWAQEDGVTLSDLNPEPQRPRPKLVTNNGTVIELLKREDDHD